MMILFYLTHFIWLQLSKGSNDSDYDIIWNLNIPEQSNDSKFELP